MSTEMMTDLVHGCRPEVLDLCQKTRQMLRLTWEGFKKQDTRTFASAMEIGRHIHRREKELTDFFVKKLPSSAADLEPGQELAFIPMHLERIGDNIEFLIRAIQSMIQEGIPFSDRAHREINDLFEKTLDLLDCIPDALATKNRILVRHLLAAADQYEQTADQYALVHQQRLIEGVCMPKSSSVYLAILDYLKGIEWHTRLIARKLSGGAG